LHALGENERIWFSSDIVRPRAIARTRVEWCGADNPAKSATVHPPSWPVTIHV